MNSLRDNKGSYRAEPAMLNLGARGALLKGALLERLREALEPIGDPGQRDLAHRSAFGRAMRRFVEIVGEHERDEQHRALGAEPACGTIGHRPALGEHRAEHPDTRFLPVATGDRVRTAADIEHDLRHQLALLRVMTSSSAATASAIRAFSAAWRRASAAPLSARALIAASIRPIAASIRSTAVGASGSVSDMPCEIAWQGGATSLDWNSLDQPTVLTGRPAAPQRQRARNGLTGVAEIKP